MTPAKPTKCQHDASAEIVADVAGFAKSGLDEPGAGAGDVGGRKRDGFAEGIEGLLDALPHFDGGLFLGLGGWPPRARRRAPSTELGVTAAAPKAKTTSATVTNTTMVRIINGIV